VYFLKNVGFIEKYIDNMYNSWFHQGQVIHVKIEYFLRDLFLVVRDHIKDRIRIRFFGIAKLVKF
jgi:hypothetical protein